jgi:hypothetical protein
MRLMMRSLDRLVLLGLAVAALLTAAGCADTQRQVRSDYDRTANFSGFRTYDMMPGAGRSPTGGDYSTLVAQRIETAIHREMTARGYVRDANPDLLVNFQVTVENVQKVSTVPTAGPPAYSYRYGAYRGWPTYSYETWVREYDEGTLLIDLVDARRQQLVWEGAGTGRVTKEKLDNIEATVNAAVAAIFERYPFRAGGSGVPLPPQPAS